MNVARIAQAMTAGAPSSGFTAHVMAPIHGRPRPDFTARVMQRVAEQDASPKGLRHLTASPEGLRHRGARVRVAQPFRARVLLIPAALVIAAGIIVFRGSRVTLLTVPAGPTLAAALTLHTPVASTTPRVVHAPAGSSPSRAVPRRPRAELPAAITEVAAIYTIAALDGPSEIGVKPIEPSTPAVLPLTGPAPLKVTDLPGAPGGSRDQIFKERP